MPGLIGRSTDASTMGHRDDVIGKEVASFRYNNPGAQYPSARAARFGQLGYGVIGGGHKIARFPSPVNGAAANFDLLMQSYTEMTIGEAGKKWTGAISFGIPGYPSSDKLTKETVRNPTLAIQLLKAIAGRESGKGSNLTGEQWKQAHAMFLAGSADAYLDGLPTQPVVNPTTAGPSGAGLVQRARAHIGERYVNVLVPKDNANWKGPWDCAEFVSWLVYQEAQILYGCDSNSSPPAAADAYTGYWQRDVEKLGKRVSVKEAASIEGGILLRYPPRPGAMGHIAVCDGKGGTIEAKGQRYGVVADKVSGRNWDTGVLISGIDYGASSPLDIGPPSTIYSLNAPNLNAVVVKRIQLALRDNGYDPGEIDGEFGPKTKDAVIGFQEAEGLVVDGEVGLETADALGISLDPAAVDEAREPEGPVPSSELPADTQKLLTLLLAKLLSESGDGKVSAEKLLPLLMQSSLTGKPLNAAELVGVLVGGQPPAATSSDKPVLDPAQLVKLLLPLLVQVASAGSAGVVTQLLPLLLPLAGASSPASGGEQRDTVPAPVANPSAKPLDLLSLIIPLLLGRLR